MAAERRIEDLGGRPKGGLLPTLALIAAFLAIAYVLSARWSSRVLFDGESAFGRVRVVESGDGLRSLYTGEGRARQSAVYPGRPLHLVSEYARVAMVGLALVPTDARILYVGLGGGAMPMYTRQVLPSAFVEVVEIDPLIIDLAPRFFGFRADDSLVVHTGDGRAFIERSPGGTYDLIVLDAFSDDEIPYALSTREFLLAVRRALAPEGVVVSNLWSTNELYLPMLATYAAVFPDLHLIQVGRGIQRILIASEVPRFDPEVLRAAAGELAARTDLGFDLRLLVERGYRRLPPLPARILEDGSRH